MSLPLHTCTQDPTITTVALNGLDNVYVTVQGGGVWNCKIDNLATFRRFYNCIQVNIDTTVTLTLPTNMPTETKFHRTVLAKAGNKPVRACSPRVPPPQRARSLLIICAPTLATSAPACVCAPPQCHQVLLLVMTDPTNPTSDAQKAALAEFNKRSAEWVLRCARAGTLHRLVRQTGCCCDLKRAPTLAPPRPQPAPPDASRAHPPPLHTGRYPGIVFAVYNAVAAYYEVRAPRGSAWCACMPAAAPQP